MNERIRLLAKQAENMALSIPGSLSPEQFREIEQDIFAELIVRKCMDIAYAYDAPKLSGPGMIVANRIEDHFGVEE